MMAIRLDANERSLADLYYGHAPKFVVSRKMIGAVALVGAAYGALGLYFAIQRFYYPQPADLPGTPVTLMQRWMPKTPPPPPQTPQAHPQAQTPPVDAVRETQAPVIDTTTQPIQATQTETPPVGPVASLPTVANPPIATGSAVATGPASPPGPRVIRNPDWLSMPTPQQTSAAFPSRALRLAVSGRAELNCSVLASGAVAACEIASETPSGYGFGQAALKMAPYFRMNPRTVDGQVVEGAKVKIPVNFNPGD